MKEFCVVLVYPRDPKNIGSVARAMGNFGLTDLRVVKPFTPVWREAITAVGVGDILLNAKHFETLGDALADTTFSFAATALRDRQISQEIVSLPNINKRLITAPDGKIALVFGNEKSGLAGEDIARCSVVLNIPTVSKQPSINLAQATILTCYELSKREGFSPIRSAKELGNFPTDAQRELFVNSIEVLCEKMSLRADLPLELRKAFIRQLLTRQGISQDHLFFLKKLVDKINARLP